MAEDWAFGKIVDRHLQGMLAAVRTVYELDDGYGHQKLLGPLTQEVAVGFDGGWGIATLVVEEREAGARSDRTGALVRPVLRVCVASGARDGSGHEVGADTARLARYLAETNGGHGLGTGATDFEVTLPDEPPWVR